VAGADACLTVQQLVAIGRKADPVLNVELPKHAASDQLLAISMNLIPRLEKLREEMTAVPSVIDSAQVTEGRDSLAGAIDLALDGWRDVAQSIQAPDVALGLKAAQELSQVYGLYRTYINDVFALSACF
jgi:hypothetical protein